MSLTLFGQGLILRDALNCEQLCANRAHTPEIPFLLYQHILVYGARRHADVAAGSVSEDETLAKENLTLPN